MKRMLTIANLAETAHLVAAFRIPEQQGTDKFRIMGISGTEVEVLMKENLLYASLSTPPVSKLKAIAPGKRAALVKKQGVYVKKLFQHFGIYYRL